MSLFSWFRPKTAQPSGHGARNKPRRSFGQTTLPLISPRRGRRILRREQLFSVVRESLIRAGVLSTSYEFKVLALDSSADGFLVLIDLALAADVMPDAYLQEIEHWIQGSARSRHEMDIPAVYWRRKLAPDQHGIALKASVAAQTRREAASASATSIPAPDLSLSSHKVQNVGVDEVDAFRKALAHPAIPAHRMDSPPETGAQEREPEAHSDFSALSETQYGKL